MRHDNRAALLFLLVACGPKAGRNFSRPDAAVGYLPGFFALLPGKKFWGYRRGALRDPKGGLEKGPEGGQ